MEIIRKMSEKGRKSIVKEHEFCRGKEGKGKQFRAFHLEVIRGEKKESISNGCFDSVNRINLSNKKEQNLL